MKDFIFKIFIFILPILVIIIIMEVSIRQIPNDLLFKKEYLDAHSNDINTLILGSSHTYDGIDPIYFSNNTFNAAYNAQTLKFDYEILKKYEKSFDNLKTVILPLSYFTLFEKLEEGAEPWRVKDYIIYYDIRTSHSLKYHTEMLSNKFNLNLKRFFSYYIRGNANMTSSKLGAATHNKSYKSSDLRLKESGKPAALRHTAKDFQYLQENFITLKSIITLCKNHNVNILLLTPPAFISYRQSLNTVQLNKTIKIANQMAKDYRNCQYINLLESKEFVAKDFFDADHLNEIGTKKLSLLINDEIKKLK